MAAQELLQKLVNAFSRGDIETILACYHPEVVIDVQFDFPPKRLEGKETLAKGVSRLKTKRRYQDIKISNLTVFETNVADVAIAEWTYTSKVGDMDFVNTNVIIATLRDGLIYRCRDYHNHVTRAITDGELPAVIKQIEALPRPAGE